MFTIKRLIVLVLMLLYVQFPGIAEIDNTIPNSWGMIYETTDPITAARQVCLAFNSTGYWKDAEFQTVGLYIFNQEENSESITLQLYASRRVYKVVKGKIKEVAGSHYPALISFMRNEYSLQLTRYQIPEEDSSQYWKDMIAMFGETLANDIAKNSEKYAKLAKEDASLIAEQYISASENEKNTIPCISFLHSGTDSKAADIIQKSISGRYPFYAGKAISYVDGILYTLSVEGESSLSGILTYESFSQKGEQLTYVKVQVDGKTLKVIDGELPSLYD